MFGGLELKKENDDATPDTAVPAATNATSSFGFLNSASGATTTTTTNATSSKGTEASVAEGPSTSSGFSFLNSGASEPPANNTEPVPVPVPEPVNAPAPTSSGFSFLQGNSAPTSAPGTKMESQAADGDAAANEEIASSSSGFSFMIPSPGKASAAISGTTGELDAAQADSTTDVATNVAPPASLSAFDFLSGASQDESDSPSLAVSAAPTASTSTLMAATSVPTSDATAGLSIPSALPTGAGITFGTAASSKKPVVRKKKTRAQRVGTGVATVTQTSSPPKAARGPSTNISSQSGDKATTSSTSNATTSSSSTTRDAANEAQKRAEAFMNQKTKTEASTATATAISTTTTKTNISTYNEEPTLATTASSDEEVAQARRAAEEAQKMASGKEGRGGFMGTFFKGFGGSSSSSLKTTTDNKPPRPIATAATSSTGSVTSHSNSQHGATTGNDLVEQQQEMKRAAAERQMQMQLQRQASTDHSTTNSESDAGYTPNPPVTNMRTPSPPTLTVSSSFEPPKEIPLATIPATKTSSSDKNNNNHIVVKELASTPKQKKTATQAFKEYQAIFAHSVDRSMLQVESVRSQQKMLTEERFVSIAKQRLATQQIEQTEAQLQVAVDNEDYELADQLGQMIDGHKREMAEVGAVLDSIAKGLEQLEAQKALVVQGVATCFDNLALHIKDLQNDESMRDRDFDAEALKKFATISKQLSAEQERLNQDLKLLERDESLVAEERTELETAISEQSGEYEKQRSDSKAKLDALEEEITELRRQLEMKSKIAAGLRTEMHGLEDSISKVRVKFSRQLARVDKKEATVHENRLEWETETVIFKRQKEAHDAQVQAHSEALLEHDQLKDTLSKELTLCKEFAGLVSTKLGFFKADAKSKEAEDAELESNLAQLQADVVKCEAACSEARVILKAATAAISKLEAEQSFLIARVPQLEAEKKAAAAKRDFKAASKASKEIKDATTRLKECEEELSGEATEKKVAAEEEVKKFTAELEIARKIAEEEEKVSGIARMHDLAEQIKSLVATKEELCGDISSDDTSVKGVGACVLDGQIKVLKDEGEDLNRKYGGWQQLIGAVFPSEGGESTDTEVAQEATVEEPIPEKTEVADDAQVEGNLSSEQRIKKFRDLIKRIQEAEPLLEAAVEREDYDEAARLQDIFENAQSELENINLSEEESAIAFAEEEPTAAPPSSVEETETNEAASATSDVSVKNLVEESAENVNNSEAISEGEAIDANGTDIADDENLEPVEKNQEVSEDNADSKDASSDTVDCEEPDAGAEDLGKGTEESTGEGTLNEEPTADASDDEKDVEANYDI